ncbi:MAG: sulfocyanin-like copper-binding protein [Terracoccus sp.]
MPHLPPLTRLAPVTRALLILATAGALLAGCSTATEPGAPGAQNGAMMGGNQTPDLFCAAPTGLPGTRVTVSLGDVGMTGMMMGDAPTNVPMQLIAQPASVPAGKVSLVVENRGWRLHEVVVLPLAKGASAGQRVVGSDGKVDEAGSLGESSTTCASGSGEGIASGAVGWVTVTLAPGRYELVCNLKNHYANGMRQELVVTG